VLHVATHGFFLGDQKAGEQGSRGLELVTSDPSVLRPAAPRIENPLLRSGLAFAGANGHRADGDGIVTALEASGLDLWGTRLVVLSACETGVGDVQNGDGVYGLRRALVMAGAESEVMSLWKVDDEATRDLMIAYYTGLVAGGGRTEALRAAQLGLLATKARSHPYFWASFIPSGDWRTLDGKEIPPADGAFGRVGPGACGCMLAGTTQWPTGAVGAALLAVLAILRRRGE
jgi:CHAT domain-containing protein